jgi:hypothetical protein
MGTRDCDAFLITQMRETKLQIGQRNPAPVTQQYKKHTADAFANAAKHR